jgi:hypothetical protein
MRLHDPDSAVTCSGDAESILQGEIYFAPIINLKRVGDASQRETPKSSVVNVTCYATIRGK